MAYGLTVDGFVTKTLGLIRSDINTAIRLAFGASVKVNEESIFGQIIGIISAHLAQLWDLAEAVNASMDPDAATGTALEQLCLLTGTLRPQATYSSVTLMLTGDDTSVIPAGTKVTTLSTEQEFETVENTTLDSTDVLTWATATAYAVGDIVNSNDNLYYCIEAGTSEVVGPLPQPPDFEFNGIGSPDPQPFYEIVDGTATWVYLGAGDAVASVVAKATVTGPVAAVTYDIHGEDSLVNAPTGLSGVTNLVDATPGRNIATDAELRILREQELATGGSTPINALRAELLNVADVVSVSVFQNVYDVTNADGIPPHSIEVLVRGPASPSAAFDQSIFDALGNGVAAGIRTHGTSPNDVVGTFVDDEGTAHEMKFTRPENVDIYVDVELIVDPDEYPPDGDDQVKAAIVAYGNAQDVGKDVTAARLIAAIFSVPGVLDVTQCFIDDAPAPAASTTVAISLRQLAVFNTANIDVATTDGVP